MLVWNYNTEISAMRKVKRRVGEEKEEEDGTGKDLWMGARGAEEACKTERGYPAWPPRHFCCSRSCPLTHLSAGSTGRGLGWIPHCDTHSTDTITCLLMSCLHTQQPDAYSVSQKYSVNDRGCCPTMTPLWWSHSEPMMHRMSHCPEYLGNSDTQRLSIANVWVHHSH